MRVGGREKASAARLVFALALHLTALAAGAAAQSSDPDFPTPALTNEIAGRIAPLDVGDSRRTRHFYAFSAQPGDLELTVEGANLEGDVDVFAAANLRPLAKVTLYAGLGSPVSRTIYLRRAEQIVLRVQARTPNDAEGSYRIRLGGTFVPAIASSTSEPNTTPTPTAAESAAARPRGTGVRRVTSVGARIEEPKPEVAADVEAAKPAAPEPTPERAAPATARRTTGNRSRTPRARTEGARAGSAGERTARDAGRARDESAAREEPPREPARSETAEAAAAERPAPRATRGRAGRTRTGGTARRGGQAAPETASSAAAAEPAAPAATGLELPGTRLVLELREGGRLEREMSGVRRVTVERGLIVIMFRDGRVERQPLSNVLRMSIEP